MSDRTLQDQPRGRIPDVTLERYRLGELPRAEIERIGRFAAHDDRLRDRLEAIGRSDGEIRREYPPDRLVRDVMARAGQRRGSRYASHLRLTARWAIPAALVATVAIVVLRQETGAPADRPKGASASLVIYRSEEAGSRVLSDNDIARAGEVVRVGYRAAEEGYGAIVSLDGRGVVTFHMPTDGQRPVALEPGKTVLLDKSFELDDAPSLERFYLVTAPGLFEMTPVLEAIRRASAGAGGGEPAPLLLPAPLNHATFSLRKDTRP